MARGFAPEEAEAAFAKGQRELEVVRRQAAISQLYPHQVYIPTARTTTTSYIIQNAFALFETLDKLEVIEHVLSCSMYGTIVCVVCVLYLLWVEHDT